MISVSEEPFSGELTNEMARVIADDDRVALWWLGQAGFAFRRRDNLGLIDPYLSDYLAQKYQGKQFEHKRIMQSPVDPADVRGLSFVLCTHRHSDHMDPESLPIIARMNPSCRFVVPRAEAEHAIVIGLPEERLTLVNAGEIASLGHGIEVEVIASAHEELITNDAGEHRFLGYIIRLGGLTLYHPGDCVPYPGLDKLVASHKVDIALMPVNGRDEYRRNRGVPGNFTVHEALDLCRACRIPVMVAHHFGMFEFNTVDVRELTRLSEDQSTEVRMIVPRTGVKYFAEA